MSLSANMLGLLLLAFLGLAAARTGDRLALLNYGVLLEERADVDLNRENWVHTLRVNFPLHISLTPDAENACIFSNSELCRQHPAVSNHLKLLKKDLLEQWDNLVNMFRSLPLANFTRTAPLTQEAQISNSIYDNIQDQRRTDNYNFIRNLNHSSSSGVPSTPVVDLIKDMKNRIGQFQKLVVEVSKKLESGAAAALATDLTIAADLALKVQLGVQRVQDTLKSAKKNVLTQDLLSTRQVSLILVNIENMISRKYEPFRLPNTASSYFYYNDVPTYFHIEGNDLYVSVLVPLTYKSRYTAYRVMPFPLVYGDSPYGTLLSNLPDYFLVDQETTNLYTTMSAAEFAQCKQYKIGVTTCPQTYTAVKGNLRPHCLMGLVTENKTMIQQTCQYGLLTEPLKPSIWEYSPGKVLLTKAKEILVHCKPKVHRIDSAPVQVVDLPCQCYLKADHMKLQDRLVGCAEGSAPRARYPFNLGALLQVHSAKSLKDFNGTGLLDTIPEVDLPKLSLTPADNHDLHEMNTGLSLNLTTIMLKWRRGESVYTSPVDALLEAEQNRLVAGPRITIGVVSAIAIILFLLCCASAWILTTNHRHLSQRILLLEHQTCLEADDDNENGPESVPMQVVVGSGNNIRTVENGNAHEHASLTANQ